MRPFKLGLSRPKAKKKDVVKTEESTDSTSTINTSEIDEINVSRETIEDISDAHLKRAVKVSESEPKSILEDSVGNLEDEIESPSILELVEKVSKNDGLVEIIDDVADNNETVQCKAADLYDMQKGYIPEAGTSKINNDAMCQQDKSFVYNSDSSLDENSTGITSFYTSKIFDLSLEASGNSPERKVFENHEIKVKIESYEHTRTVKDTDINIYGDGIITSGQRRIILTPKIKPPTRNHIENTLEQYNIPKVVYTAPYYSNHKDVGSKVEIGQMVLKLQSKLARDQKPFEKVSETSLEEWRHLLFTQTNEMYEESTKPENLRTLLAGNKTCILEPVKRPPTNKEVKQWIEDKSKTIAIETKVYDISKNIEELDNSQALGLNEDVIDNSIQKERNDKVSSIQKHYLPVNYNKILFCRVDKNH